MPTAFSSALSLPVSSSTALHNQLSPGDAQENGRDRIGEHQVPTYTKGIESCQLPIHQEHLESHMRMNFTEDTSAEVPPCQMPPHHNGCLLFENVRRFHCTEKQRKL